MQKRVSGTEEKQKILIALGEVIRAVRLEKGVSQEALAHISGIDRSHICKIERGERNVSILNIERIALALEVLPSQLLEDAGF